MGQSFFYERFRDELAKYAEGVHRLGNPATKEAVAHLPEELAAFLRSWNGADLFHDAYTIFEASQIAATREGDEDLLIFATTADEDELALSISGQVIRLEEDTGEVLVEGTSFDRWLEGVVLAEGVLYDREGEFRDNVFDETGEELAPDAVIKREKKVLKIDPKAPAPAWRLARALEKKGRIDEAIALLKAIQFPWAQFDLGRLLLKSGDPDLMSAQEAFLRAAELDPKNESAGYFAAHAARAAALRGDETARTELAARALALDPGLARAQKEACQARVGEGAIAEARELWAIAIALAPRDLELLSLGRRI